MLEQLYEKYQAAHYKDLPTVNPLSFILRKAELGCAYTESEWQWLDQRQLLATKEIIKNQENYRESLLEEIGNEIVAA